MGCGMRFPAAQSTVAITLFTRSRGPSRAEARAVGGRPGCCVCSEAARSCPALHGANPGPLCPVAGAGGSYCSPVVGPGPPGRADSSAPLCLWSLAGAGWCEAPGEHRAGCLGSGLCECGCWCDPSSHTSFLQACRAQTRWVWEERRVSQLTGAQTALPTRGETRRGAGAVGPVCSVHLLTVKCSAK